MRSAAQLASIFPPPNAPPMRGVCAPAEYPLKQFAVENTGGATAVFTGIFGASIFSTLLPTLDTDPPALWLEFRFLFADVLDCDWFWACCCFWLWLADALPPVAVEDALPP